MNIQSVNNDIDYITEIYKYYYILISYPNKIQRYCGNLNIPSTWINLHNGTCDLLTHTFELTRK